MAPADAPGTPRDAAPLRPWELGLLAALAALARTFNLGSYSLWLDEIYLMLRARAGGPAEVWAACRANAEHPPLSALVMAAGNALGFSDTAHRLVPAVLGTATVVLLALWTGRLFGRPAGLATGLVVALLPFHVRYSQELRPYAYLLFFLTLILLAADALERRPGPGAAALLGLALAGGLYSHMSFALVLLPLAVLLGEPAFARNFANAAQGGVERRRRAFRTLGWALAGLGGGLLLWLPWLPVLLGVPEKAARGRVRPWTWGVAAKRWQFLTVGGDEGDRLTWAGVLALGLLVLGVLAALRSTAGQAALLGALVGTVGVELILLRANHWSHGRYDCVGWLFLMALLGAGFGLLWRVRAARVPAALALAALLVGEAGGLARYARVGRPDWDRVAEAVRRVRRPGETVLVENHWTRVSLGYYLQGPDFDRRHGEDGAPVIVEGGPRSLRRFWPADRSAVLVLAGFPRNRPLRRWSQSFPRVGRFPRSESRVHLLTPELRRQLYASGRRAAGRPARGAPLGDRPLPPIDPPPEQHPLLARLERLALARGGTVGPGIR